MGEVIALIRLMPDGVITDKDMDSITEEVKKVVQKPARLGRASRLNKSPLVSEVLM